MENRRYGEPGYIFEGRDSRWKVRRYNEVRVLGTIAGIEGGASIRHCNETQTTPMMSKGDNEATFIEWKVSNILR